MFEELQGRKVPADHFAGFVAANVDNMKLTDSEFRQVIRNTISIVEYAKKRTDRCIHGVSELNTCTRCD